MSVIVHHGDSREVLKTLAEASIDAVVCDPPYALVSIGKRFGKEGAAPAKVGKTGAYARASKGFMGKTWDTGETAFSADFWVEVSRVLKPGGHVVAFSGTRTYHRLACAVEDAGFEIRDMVAWLYGSGFPKSHDVSKGIDKLDAAAERRSRNLKFTAWLRGTGITAAQINEATGSFMGSHYLTDRKQAAVPTEDMFALLRPLLPAAPAFVEALVAERTVESQNFKARAVVGERLTGIGTGGGSVAYIGDSENRDITAAHTSEAAKWEGWGSALKPALEPVVLARKPMDGTIAANVLEHGTGALNVEGCRVGPAREARDLTRNASLGYGGSEGQGVVIDGGSGRWPANVLHDGSDEVIAAFPEAPGQQQDINPTAPSPKTGTIYGKMNREGEASAARRYADKGSTDFAPLPGQCRTDRGSAARFFYSAKADAEDRLGSKHPTVKPVDLMAWLCRLVTPPGGVILDPFAGTGTTGLAAMREGFDCILIEREAEYVADIERRLAWARGEGRLTAQETARTESKTVDDLPLFSTPDVAA